MVDERTILKLLQCVLIVETAVRRFCETVEQAQGMPRCLQQELLLSQALEMHPDIVLDGKTLTWACRELSRQHADARLEDATRRTEEARQSFLRHQRALEQTLHDWKESLN